MVTKPELEWIQFYGVWSVGGDRDVLLIVSTGEIQEDVVPREKVELADDDWRKMEHQGIPPDCNDDLSILQARISLDKSLELVGVEVSEPGRELSRSYILGKLEELLISSTKPGVIIYYIGHGRKDTGDWCFQDGFITFRDIVSLYTNHFCDRVLTIVCDCSHSGYWVKDCSLFLTDKGVLACGHSAFEKGVFLRVYTSCKPSEVAATPCFSVQAANNDKNTGVMSYYLGKEIRKEQHSYGRNFTAILCGKKPEDPCALSSTFTWEKKREAERVYLVRGKDHGQPAWHYVLLKDDEERMKTFHEKIATGTVDVAEFGEVLKSGWGKDPPNEVVDWIEKNYNAVYT